MIEALTGSRGLHSGPADACRPQQVETGGLHFGTEAHGLLASNPQLLDPREPIVRAHGGLNPGPPAIRVDESLAFLGPAAYPQPILLAAIAQEVFLFTGLRSYQYTRSRGKFHCGRFTLSVAFD